MDDFDRYLNEQMKDPDFKKEWVENEARYQLMMMVLRARNEEHLTHLSWRSAQGFGSRISAALRKVSQCLPLLHLRRLRRDLESGSKSVLYSFTRKQNPRFAKRQIGGFHLCTHESEFHSEQSYGVEDAEDGDAGICEDGDPHIGIA